MHGKLVCTQLEVKKIQDNEDIQDKISSESVAKSLNVSQ